ncbi:uncharacterized protein LOC135946958 [Cloeon dipterum]|uniref:uncharacterized protein LOC135946958 n=1 Tax=Cloeon dipterum TaxID=197152 RepID=UPI00321F89A2
MGCASTSMGGSVVEQGKPGSAPYTAKVHPMHQVQVLADDDINAAPNTPSSEKEAAENGESGYHEMKSISMGTDAIESMMLHILEDKEREAVLTEIIIPLCPPENNNNNNNESEEHDYGLKSYDAKFYDGFKPMSEEQRADEQRTIIMEVIMEAQEEVKQEEYMFMQTSSDEKIIDAQAEETPEQEECKEDKNDAAAADESNEESNEEVDSAPREQTETEQATESKTEQGAALEASHNAAADEDGSSELLFDLSAEDVEMLEAQLRELSVLSPIPAVPQPAAALDGLLEGHGLMAA